LDVPALTPVTIPRLQFTVATDVLLLDHNPPGAGLLKTEVEPRQIVVDPLIRVELTFTTAVTLQPELNI
jgi:hypothetical protein